jgi:hypothetical protein
MQVTRTGRMGRSTGAKDKSKRVRRTSTEAEKRARKNKKARLKKDNVERERARARASFFEAPVVVPEEGATPLEPEVHHYKEVHAFDCNGTS